jgi:hypothetical protein
MAFVWLRIAMNLYKNGQNDKRYFINFLTHNLTNPLNQMSLFLSDFVSELADKQGHDVFTQWPLQNEIK